MKRFITLLAALAAITLTAFAGEIDNTYSANIGTRYELRSDTVVPVPLQCTITLSETGAAITFRDNAGRHVYTAAKAERVSDATWVFQGFAAYLPDGSRGRFVGAEIMEDGALMVLFQCTSERYVRSYIFHKQ